MIALCCLLAVAGAPKRPVDRYDLTWPHVRASITVSGEFKDAKASVVTTLGRHRWDQKLGLPPEWWPINAKEADQSYRNWDRPAVMAWPGVRRPVIVLRVSPQTGVYETSSLAFFEWKAQQWKLVTNDLWKCSFCDMGAFCFRGRQLHVWDPIYGDNRAHGDSHRFELMVFELRGQKVRTVSTRRTKRRYLPGDHSPALPDANRFPPDSVAAIDDPLREFGLKWRWWGKPR